MKQVLLIAVVVAAAVLLTVAIPSQALAAGPAYHVVQPGETLSSIASHYGISAWSLARANGIWNWNIVYVGQTITIPYGGYPYGNYGQPYGNYGQPYGNYGQPNYNYNQNNYGHPNNYYNVSYYPRQTYGCTYWVRYGDTMSSIAWRYGTNAWTLAHANGIYNLNWIYAGQRLVIPGCN